VLISVEAAEIPPHVEEGFGMNPGSFGKRVIARKLCTFTER